MELGELEQLQAIDQLRCGLFILESNLGHSDLGTAECGTEPRHLSSPIIDGQLGTIGHALRYRGIVISFASPMPRSTPDSDKAVKVPIGFPEELYEWLRETAHQRRVSMAQIVRDAVAEYKSRSSR